MRWIVLLFSAATLSLVGCSSQGESPSDAVPSHGKETTKAAAVADTPTQEKAEFVFRAKYYRTKGPCIQIGNTFAMPVVDGFEVVEVISGKFRATNIEVRPGSGGGASYPQSMTDGKVYTLKLAPSERTKQQLQEMENEGRHFVWVDGDEIEEFKAGKQ